MKAIKTDIDGVFVLKPSVYKDERGYFYESFSEEEFKSLTGINFKPVQDNQSKSSFGVIRGLHFQNPPYEQAKLVRVVKGAVLDVAVDLRPHSKTRGQYFSVLLTEHNHLQLFIPKGFAHGFAVLSEEAIFQYKCDNYYHPESENGIAWDDKTVNVIWCLPQESILLSNKDKNRQTYDEYISNGS